MNWSNIKKWAKDQGYSSFRERTTDPNNQNEYDYYWEKIDDPNASGLAISVSKLATQIYNHITDDAHVEHQEKYKMLQSKQDIDHNGISQQW